MFRYKELSTLRKLILFKKLIASSIKVVSGAIASFVTKRAGKAISVLDSIEPIQDLHGYENPWPAGGGKNKFHNTGTTQTINGVTFTVNSDGTVFCSGTATATAVFRVYLTYADLPQGESLILNGCPSDGSFISKYGQALCDSFGATLGGTTDSGTGATYSVADLENLGQYQIVVRTGINANGIVFKPMTRLASVTDATYAPYSNICPISGHTEVVTSRCGVNVWDEEWENGYIAGGIEYVSNACIRSKNYNTCNPSETYYLHCGSATNQYFCRPIFYDADKNFISNGVWCANNTITAPSNAYYFRLTTQSAPSATYGGTYNHDISINYPSTDHDYHAYNGTSYTTDLGRTVYGGTLDVVSGLLTVDRVMVTVDENDTIEYASNSNGFLFYCANKCTGAKNNGVQICDRLSLAESGTASTLYTAESGFVGYSIGVLYFKINTSIATVADMKSYLSSAGALQVVYELATPQTIQLTPQEVELLKGQNNLWCDSGNIEVTYKG